MIEETVEIVIKEGKKKFTEEEISYHFHKAVGIFEEAMAVSKITKHIGNKPIKKVIYVPDRVLNIIV